MLKKTIRLQDKDFKYIVESKVGSVTTINEKEYLYFAGTGYFQLQSHSEMIKAACNATIKFGIGSATSRTISGTTNLLLELEHNIAGFFEAEAAVYLPSGYLSNIAGFQALEELGLFDVIFIDENAHYSNIGGARLIGKKIITFNHLSFIDLRNKIKKHLKGDEKPLIVSDGLFPIWAELAPLTEYLKIAEEFNGAVWIDDSHSVGILGENGRGIYEYLQLESKRLFMGATLSKAFGAYGGFVIGNSKFIKTVKTGNVITGSSSPPNAMVAAALKGLEIVENNPELRLELWENAKYLKKEIRNLGLKVDDNYLPIVTFSLGTSEKMEHIHQELMEMGIYIQYVKYVGSGSEGVLRIVVTSSHSKEQIDLLVSSLGKLI